MGFAKELREPWGLLLAAGTAGVAWAVQLSPLAAVCAGVVVLGTRAGVAALGNKGVPEPVKAIDVDPRSPEGGWAARAAAAASGFESVSASLRGGPLAERVADMEPGVQETVVTLRRLAERATMTGRAADRVNLSSLTVEKARLHRSLQSASEDVRGDLDQALASVQAQEDVHARLTGARNKLLARLQSGTLGLEALVTRVVELSALEDSDTPDTSMVADLGDQLEGIRRGVVETDEATRRALGT
jgi:hypothetical protein